jgi:uncharacterized delta-60 repeat protein
MGLTMARQTPLLVGVLALTACSSLVGRTSPEADAATDAQSDAAVSDRPETPQDVARPPSDAPACPMGLGTALDPRLNVTLRDTGPETALSGHSFTHAFGDGDDHLYLVGLCRGCVAGSSADAAVWRFTADGRLDARYGRGGLALEGEASSLTWFNGALDGDGRVLAVGVRRPLAPALARFTTEGQPDAAFNAAWARAQPLRALGTGNQLLFGVVADPDGVLVVGGNGSPSNEPSTLGFAMRLRSDGALDTDFATGGVLLRGDLHGCYDVVRDGAGWVLGCISLDDRPALLRLDAEGHAVRWGTGEELAVHAAAPRGFQLRSLQRDSAGRWIAAGAIARVYNDLASPPAAVRFDADGAPDPRYGVEGVATLAGARQTFAYTFASGSYVGCEDRLLMALALGTLTGVGVFDRDGRLMTDVGDEGVLLTTGPGAAVGIGVGLVPSRLGDAVTLLSSFGQPNFSMLHRLRL